MLPLCFFKRISLNQRIESVGSRPIPSDMEKVMAAKKQAQTKTKAKAATPATKSKPAANAKPKAKVVEKPKAKPSAKPAAKPVAKAATKTAAKPAAKPVATKPGKAAPAKAASKPVKEAPKKMVPAKSDAKTEPLKAKQDLMTVKTTTAKKEPDDIQVVKKAAPVKVSKAKKAKEEKSPPAELGLTTGQKGNVEKLIKKMIARGKERGFITYDELNNALPAEEFSSDEIEDAMTAISDSGVQLVDSADDVSDETEKDEKEEKEGKDGEEYESGGNISDDDTGRTDDPVRMYLREMGSVELLSREGEIAIAKRIEAGRNTMIAGLCESPLTFQAIIIWRDELAEGKILLRDIIDLGATYAGPDAKAAPAMPGAEGEGGIVPPNGAGPNGSTAGVPHGPPHQPYQVGRPAAAAPVRDAPPLAAGDEEVDEVEAERARIAAEEEEDA